MDLILFCAAAYILGAVPFSYIVAKLVKGIDIREHGSGNPGATNVYRVVGAVPGVITYVLDFAKGFLPVFFAALYFGQEKIYFWLAVALCAIAGHVWTIFLKFRGGKGVATGSGVFFALLPLPAAAAFALFWIVLLISRYVSVSSIIAAASLPVFSAAFKQPRILTVFAALIAAVIIYRHKSNFKNLMNGTESKIGKKK